MTLGSRLVLGSADLRERLRAGNLTVTVEVDDTVIGRLVACGYLSESEASDARTLRTSIGRAVTA